MFQSQTTSSLSAVILLSLPASPLTVLLMPSLTITQGLVTIFAACLSPLACTLPPQEETHAVHKDGLSEP